MTISCSLLQTKSQVQIAAREAAVVQPRNMEATINSTQQREAPGAAAGGVDGAKKKLSKRDDRFWTLSNQGVRHPHDKGSQLDTKGCRCVNLGESASEVEDKRSGSLEGSAKAQLRRVINGSVSENSRRAGCDTAANCRCFKSSFDSFVIFSGFSGRMERSTNRCRSHVGAFFASSL